MGVQVFLCRAAESFSKNWKSATHMWKMKKKRQVRRRVINRVLSALQWWADWQQPAKTHWQCTTICGWRKIVLPNCWTNVERFILHVGSHNLINSRKGADWSHRYTVFYANSLFYAVWCMLVHAGRIKIDFLLELLNSSFKRTNWPTCHAGGEEIPTGYGLDGDAWLTF